MVSTSISKTPVYEQMLEQRDFKCSLTLPCKLMMEVSVIAIGTTEVHTIANVWNPAEKAYRMSDVRIIYMIFLH